MRPAVWILALSCLAAGAVPAVGLAAPRRAARAAAGFVAPAFDSRDAERDRLDGAPPRGYAATSAVRGARRDLRRSLGAGAVLDIDPLTQTPRAVQRLSGTLSGPSSSAPATVALDYVRAHEHSLGLSDTDLQTLGDRHAYTSSDGVTHLRWSQSYGGIPAYDNDLQVNVDRGGRVIDVLGSPRHDLSVADTTPALDAGQALHAAQAAFGDTHTARDDSARLVLFGAGTVRLAWDVEDDVSPSADYDAVVDASSGRILAAHNLVDFDGAVDVFDHYPGAASGGTQVTRDITPYLTSATSLTGPNAHAFVDADDDGGALTPEDVGPNAGSDWLYPFTDATSTNLTGGCDAADECSWDHTVAGSWTANAQEAATQLFWFVNQYHDHLQAAPIDFDDASGAFDGDDPLQARADVGASLGTDGNPDAGHLDNASMLTRPDGHSPTMTTQLFSDADGRFRDVNSADDAAVVFHEYTHGLSNRLITNADGTGALSEVQSSAMGEGWSDWYAMDEVVDLGLDSDDPMTPGEIDFGEYTDATPHSSRSEPIDCPVGASAPSCPGTAATGPGGYTYGDLGKLCSCGNEPHFDGEIWGQTLWDLRTALIAQTDPATGSQLAEQLITGAMRLSPPQPSMLDERNAILAEDTADLGGAEEPLIWQVFANRGMGWFASTVDANDGAPVQDFSLPPTGPDAGTVTGTVTDEVSDLPLSGADVGIGGQGSPLDALTDTGGRYTLASVPVGTYPQVVVHGPVGYDPGVAGPVTVADGQTVTGDVTLHRDWAATAGGAQFTTNDDSQAGFGCGAANLLDQSPRGWSTNVNPGDPATITISLPTSIDITGFAFNPAPTCGDDSSASLRDYEIDTSTDGGGTFHVAVSGHPLAGAPVVVKPDAAATRVNQVRLRLLDATGASPFIDLTEFEVLGAPPNVLPSGTLTATPTAADAGTTQVSLQAQFSDPDSRITGYTWDFDGNGTVDQTTTTPTVTHVYTAGGTFTAKVAAQDFRGGAGTATARVRVTPAPLPPVTTPVTTTTTVTVTAPAPPPVQTTPTPAPKARHPVLVLARGGRRGVAFTVTFAASGRTRATLTVSAALARTLHLPSRRVVVGTLSATVATARPRTLTVRLASAALAALRRHHLTHLNGVLGVTATAADGQVATATRHVTISR